MASKLTERDVAKLWDSRLATANKLYEQWESEYQPKLLQQYYLGDQRKGRDGQYVINLCFPTVEIRLPALLYNRPVYRIRAREGREDDAGQLEERIRLREGTLNTIVSDPRVKFTETMELVIREHFFAFGVVEVGFSADYLDNPNAGKPALNEANEELPIKQPERLPVNEQVYVRRIPAAQFRMASTAGNDIDTADWCGYFEYMYPSDIKANPEYKNTDKLKTTGVLKRALEPSHVSLAAKDDPTREMVKVWKIWDNRLKKKYVYPDGHDFFLQRTDFDFIPLSMLSMHPILDEPYPCPPMANWIDPQREYNETREMQRQHRKRYVRRYLTTEGSIDEAEIEKLTSEIDGTLITVKRLDSIVPLADAPLDLAVTRNVAQTKDDFLQISGVPGEARGVAEATTATQANIIDQRSQVRESYSRQKIAAFLVRIGWHILRTIETSATLPIWIASQVDPTSDNATEEAKAITEVWEQMNPEALGDLAYEVSIDVSTLSPVNEEIDRQNWSQALAILTNPALLLALSSSDLLLRKTLWLYGIKSEREVAEIKRVAQQLLVGLQAQQQAQAGQGAQGAGSGPTPSPKDIELQLARQAGVA